MLHGAFRGALVSVALVRGYHAAGCLGEVMVHRVSMVLSMRGIGGESCFLFIDAWYYTSANIWVLRNILANVTYYG